MWSAILSVVERKLTMLDAAAVLMDLRSPLGNRLEALEGNRKGQHSIRVNTQCNGEFAFFGILTNQRISKSSIITEGSND
jgi:proteic killer suppression protein